MLQRGNSANLFRIGVEEPSNTGEATVTQTVISNVSNVMSKIESEEKVHMNECESDVSAVKVDGACSAENDISEWPGKNEAIN